MQFETIHPFLDGNGRLGRLLITFLLCARGVLKEPLLYLSLYFKTHRSLYYDLLEKVRTDGAWEDWIAFFLEGAESTAKQAADTAIELIRLFDADRRRIQEIGRSALSALRVHEYMQKRPLPNLGLGANSLNISVPTVTSALAHLVKLDIAREITGRERNRIFVCTRYPDIVSAGTEPIRPV